MFVDSGTVFIDWPEWKKLVDKYPHRGLIGHIIWRPGTHPYLDQQCWFMDIKKFKFNNRLYVNYPKPIRSDRNIHDDYTPLWIKPGNEMVSHEVDNFGQELIADQFSYGLPVMNWNNESRQLKVFIYRDTDVDAIFRQYVDLAESQLWILNNEPIKIMNTESLVCPGSGLFWILNIVSSKCRDIKIVDISETQTKFCKELWEHWDGTNYGEFTYEFIKKHHVKHYQLDRTDFTELEILKFKSSSKLIPYINDKFSQLVAEIPNFSDAWNQAKIQKTVSIFRGNLVDWVLEKNSDYDNLWISNILDYKWTLLHTNFDQSQKFLKLVK